MITCRVNTGEQREKTMSALKEEEHAKVINHKMQLCVSLFFLSATLGKTKDLSRRHWFSKPI